MSLLRTIFEHPSIKDRPPVLIDLGASGEIHTKWKSIAKYSICVAFDADTREFNPLVSESEIWKKLFSLNRLVSANPSDNTTFYLTKSPFCSSSLQPDNDSLSPWIFSPLFNIEKSITLPSISLKDALSEIDIDYIDWYKTDTQGTDLRIFDSLPEYIKNGVIAAEFEPGIIDAYKEEDKLNQLMLYMDRKPFWVSSMCIKGSHRIEKKDYELLNYFQRKSISSFLQTSPGWCEISYINKMEDSLMTIRDYLLAWVFSSIEGQHGFSLLIARRGYEIFSDEIFLILQKRSKLKMSSGYLRLLFRAIKIVFRGR
jgi:hypothetical protein